MRHRKSLGETAGADNQLRGDSATFVTAPHHGVGFQLQL